MKMRVECGKSYAVEVEAEDFYDAVVKAFHERLPLAIGEVIAARSMERQRKVRFAWTAHVLERIGASDLYAQRKRGFALDTQHPNVKQIPVADEAEVGLQSKT